MSLDVTLMTINDSQGMTLAQSFKDNNKYCNDEGGNMTMSVAVQERDEREEDIVLRSANDRGHYSTSVLMQSNLTAESSSSTGEGSKKDIIQEISFETRSQPFVARAQGK
jgi:hypothetical protein